VNEERRGAILKKAKGKTRGGFRRLQNEDVKTGHSKVVETKAGEKWKDVPNQKEKTLTQA